MSDYVIGRINDLGLSVARQTPMEDLSFPQMAKILKESMTTPTTTNTLAPGHYLPGQAINKLEDAESCVEGWKIWRNHYAMRTKESLLRLRKEKGLSIRAAARLSGIPESTLRYLESGKMRFTAPVALKLAKALTSYGKGCCK